MLTLYSVAVMDLWFLNLSSYKTVILFGYITLIYTLKSHGSIKSLWYGTVTCFNTVSLVGICFMLMSVCSETQFLIQLYHKFFAMNDFHKFITISSSVLITEIIWQNSEQWSLLPWKWGQLQHGCICLHHRHNTPGLYHVHSPRMTRNPSLCLWQPSHHIQQSTHSYGSPHGFL